MGGYGRYPEGKGQGTVIYAPRTERERSTSWGVGGSVLKCANRYVQVQTHCYEAVDLDNFVRVSKVSILDQVFIHRPRLFLTFIL